MKSSINPYYFNIINDIITIIDNSENGKRIWYIDEQDKLNYSLSTKSSYPEFLKFFFNKTPKYLRTYYCREGTKCWEDGYFNGTTRDLRKMLSNALNGKLPRSERMLCVFDLVIIGYLNYNEGYYSWTNEDFEEYPF